MRRVTIRHFAGLAFFVIWQISTVGSFAQDQTYTVKKGDTLWNVSQKFYHDPALWPNMWKNNQSLTNPHLILPGERLKVFTEDRAGTRYEPSSGALAASSKSGQSVAGELEEKAPLPSGHLEQKDFRYLKMDTVGFISGLRIKEKGIIHSAEGGKELISTNDFVYILCDDPGSMKVGSQWTVYRSVPDPVYHPKTHERLGYLYSPIGEVEILRSGNPGRGRIIKAYVPISVGDQLQPLSRNPIGIRIKLRSENLEAFIIKADPPVDAIAQYNIVYINKGKRDGLEVGTCLEVLKTVLIAGKQETTTIGELIVLRTDEDTSAALVTSSRDVFSVGEKVRAKLCNHI